MTRSNAALDDLSGSQHYTLPCDEIHVIGYNILFDPPLHQLSTGRRFVAHSYSGTRYRPLSLSKGQIYVWRFLSLENLPTDKTYPATAAARD